MPWSALQTCSGFARRAHLAVWWLLVLACNEPTSTLEPANRIPPAAQWAEIAPLETALRPWAGLQIGPEAAWTSRTPNPLPSNWPMSQNGEVLAFDSRRQVIWRFGRPSAEYACQLWRWEPANGVFSLVADGAKLNPGALWPRACGRGQLIYDPTRSTVVLLDAANVSEWDGTAWTLLPQDPDAAYGLNTFAAFDNTRQRFAVVSSTNGQIWWYDAPRGEYSIAAKVPVMETITGITFHEQRGTFIIGAAYALGEWDPKGNTWTDLTPKRNEPTPSSASNSVCVNELIYLPTKQRIFTRCQNGSTFEIDVEKNLWVAPAPSWQVIPAIPGSQPHLVFDAGRRKIVLFVEHHEGYEMVWERDE